MSQMQRSAFAEDGWDKCGISLPLQVRFLRFHSALSHDEENTPSYRRGLPGFHSRQYLLRG